MWSEVSYSLPPLLFLLHFRSHSASYNWPSRLPLLPRTALYKITLVTTVSARQGGLIRSLGVLTSLGRTNRFNSLLSRCSLRAGCTTNHPSPTQWFRNCWFYSIHLSLFLVLFVSFAYPCIVNLFISSPLMLFLCNLSHLNLISRQLWLSIVDESYASFLQTNCVLNVKITCSFYRHIICDVFFLS